MASYQNKQPWQANMASNQNGTKKIRRQQADTANL